MRRFLLLVLIALAGMLVALLQQSFVAALGLPLATIDVPLFLTLFAVAIFDNRVAFGFFVVSSITSSLIAGQTLLTPLIVGLVTCTVLNELLERFFTNRAYYAVLAVGVSGWLLYGALLAAFFALFRLLDVGPADAQVSAFSSPWALLTGLVALWLFLTLFYTLTVLVSKRIRSYFIVSDRS